MYNEQTQSMKITDFGIARITSSGHTKTGTILGTPSFMSPEQMTGKPVDGRSDIFSLGVTMFVLLCGQKPFNGDSLAAISYQVVNDKQPDILALRPELPACIKRFIDKAMQKKPDNRYQDGKTMKRAIQRCLKEIRESQE
jgi:serine/threonine-protein kinase